MMMMMMMMMMILLLLLLLLLLLIIVYLLFAYFYMSIISLYRRTRHYMPWDISKQMCLRAYKAIYICCGGERFVRLCMCACARGSLSVCWIVCLSPSIIIYILSALTYLTQRSFAYFLIFFFPSTTSAFPVSLAFSYSVISTFFPLVFLCFFLLLQTISSCWVFFSDFFFFFFFFFGA